MFGNLEKKLLKNTWLSHLGALMLAKMTGSPYNHPATIRKPPAGSDLTFVATNCTPWLKIIAASLVFELKLV